MWQAFSDFTEHTLSARFLLKPLPADFSTQFLQFLMPGKTLLVEGLLP
jgi:hypothetical protein